MQNYNSKFKINAQLKKAVDFHGHLGPYLVLGLLAGELAFKKIGCKKYFDLEVKVWGADKKPKSCLVDGLQLSTGATYGKGNITKFSGPAIKIELKNLLKHKKITLKLSDNVIKKLGNLKTHQDFEAFARKIWKMDPVKLFNLRRS